MIPPLLPKDWMSGYATVATQKRKLWLMFCVVATLGIPVFEYFLS